jgi:hypothetical protein
MPKPIILGDIYVNPAHISAVHRPRPCTDIEKLEQNVSKDTALWIIGIGHIHGQASFHYFSKTTALELFDEIISAMAAL